ncbi:hypothetical protein ZIOFF_071325 [Zingiber officinale]|uniref:Polyprotein n=1 Tax=Zingiber officinale TaxID=94328 RepID=A0A8J5BE48_ZINOF|nr:hypothetical protein ZIOFF_071325 [Zingiber officinale]
MANIRTTIEQHYTSTTPLFDDQIREYQRNQRRLHTTQRAAQCLGQRITKASSPVQTLEQQIDPQAQLRLSMQERASIVPTKVLYHSRRYDAHHRVYVHRSEEPLLVTEGYQVDRSFIQEESFNHLQRSRKQYLHLGILQVRIQTLHRQEEEVMALIVFRDNCWLGDQAILATMEVDLTKGSQLVYIIPDIMLTIRDFYHNIQVSFLTRGYEQWRNGEANLLITRSIVGRLSNTPNVGFAYEVQGVVDFLTSHGVRALPRRRYSTAALQGLNWFIKLIEVTLPMQPSERGTGGFGLTSKTPIIFDKLLPREVAVVLYEEEPPLDDLDGNCVGTTSPWSSILQSTNLSLDTSEPEDDYLEHIQYLAACTQPTPHSKPDAPIWDTYANDSDWVNPFASEGGVWKQVTYHRF